MIRGRLAAFALVFLPGAIPPRAATTFPRPDAVQAPAQGDQPDTEARKRRKVQELMDKMGMRDTAKRSFEQMLTNFEALTMPDGFVEKLKARFDIDAMLGVSIDVYCEKLDEKTIDAMTAFYETEEGKKLAAALPDITVECVKRGQEYGKTLATDILQGR